MASYIFYAALLEYRLVITLFLITITAYFSANKLYNEKNLIKKKFYYFATIVFFIACLFFLKIPALLIRNIYSVEATGNSIEALAINVGVSFIIFHAISYLTDVYYESIVPELKFIPFALYMAFFPKLLQGPVERASDLIPQLTRGMNVNYFDIRKAISLIIWGLFLKIVIADRLAIVYVTPAFDNANNPQAGFMLLIGMYAFAFQLYLDFAGYTYMALGSAMLFGVKLSKNFNSPFLALSCTDFWRRWHITFSLWIKDYIFFPIQMRFRAFGGYGTFAALVLTFMLAGLWHGIGFGFMIFGLIHGLWLAIEYHTSSFSKRIKKKYSYTFNFKVNWIRIFFTFNIVCITFIFFRTNDVKDAISMVETIFLWMLSAIKGNENLLSLVGSYLFKIRPGENNSDAVESSIILVLSIIIILASNKIKNVINLDNHPIYQAVLQSTLLIFTIFFGILGNGSFEYFKF